MECANFGISTDHGRVWVNPSRQGAELREMGAPGIPGPCIAPIGDAFQTSLPVLLFKGGDVFAHYDPNGWYTNRLRSEEELVGYVRRNRDELWRRTEEFEKSVPTLGDEKIDRYLRHYMAAGIALTKFFKNGDVVTMGYTELNQRDSYWASWIHLVYWPELERRMIEESAAHQLPGGRIPTTILPLIDRKDDIDISEYFVLRVWRFYGVHGDRKFLRSLWPTVQGAIEYLKSRDQDGDGLPEQGSFWADWKDVPGVEGRLHSPHFSLLWLAALDRADRMANLLGEPGYRDLYERASTVVHEKLWNGRFYVNTWRDGRVDDTVAEEQCVGPLFGVVPPDRVPKIFEALQANENSWGVRESFPYRTNFGIEPGDYHNGAIWPFLNSVDAFSRFVCGYREDGFRLLRKIGHSDLEARGDWLPHENVHGETGENIRHPIQGWNAAYFAAVYFGAQNRGQVF